MKALKIATIATIATVLIIALCGIATAETADTYEVEAVVCEYHIAFPGVWEVTAVTAEGEEFGWFADNDDGEDWHIGDLVLLKMLKCEHEEDDEVMDVTFLGKLTPVETAHWMN